MSDTTDATARAETRPAAAGVEELRDAMPPDADVADVADVFSLLGDEARLRILIALASGRRRVRDLAHITGSSDSSVSHSLRLLRAHRVVDVHRTGREAHYALSDSHVRALLELALDHVGHSTLLHEIGESEPRSHDDCASVDGLG